ncbi:MAG: hypothetical protein Q7U97_06700 [Rhodocyclaceae bacterium]|nr:hypothetical protein [Rhodocyclaceae bacterium]
MDTVFVVEATGCKINIHHPFIAPDGTHGIDLREPTNRAKYGIVERELAPLPDGYSADTHRLDEPDYPPYRRAVRKPQEEIDKLDNERTLMQIAALETQTMLPRVTREFMLTFMEMNATPAQLAENVGYTKVKALDDQVRGLRAKLK